MRPVRLPGGALDLSNHMYELRRIFRACLTTSSSVLSPHAILSVFLNLFPFADLCLGYIRVQQCDPSLF